jgi:hypothetical protein
VQALLKAICDGYSFPTNLDKDPPPPDGVGTEPEPRQTFADDADDDILAALPPDAARSRFRSLGGGQDDSTARGGLGAVRADEAALIVKCACAWPWLWPLLCILVASPCMRTFSSSRLPYFLCSMSQRKQYRQPRQAGSLGTDVSGHRTSVQDLGNGVDVIHSPGCHHLPPTLPFTSSLGDLE